METIRMATRKQGGSTKNVHDSNPKYLGVKLFGGQTATPGSVIMKQRGTRVMPGKNVGLGKDHTLFALAPGVVTFRQRRKKRFDGKTLIKKVVDVLPS